MKRRIPSTSALKTSTIPRMAPLNSPYVAAITIVQNANMGIRLLLKLLGKSCPVTLLNGALGTKANSKMITTAISSSTITALSAKRCLYAKGLVLFRNALVMPLSAIVPHAIATTSIHTKGFVATLLTKEPKNHLMPSLPSNERTVLSGIAAAMSHDTTNNSTCKSNTAAVK